MGEVVSLVEQRKLRSTKIEVLGCRIVRRESRDGAGMAILKMRVLQSDVMELGVYEHMMELDGEQEIKQFDELSGVLPRGFTEGSIGAVLRLVVKPAPGVHREALTWRRWERWT